ncbi:MAG TPA: protein translocase subunit SecF [Methanoregulaceae archaeon]|nr:protein translocase subunit SecF [Methanoregulaceae archaeon]HPD75889.1 protein translocase subunit SecF [Methanoregulaceae archaeon]HRY75981.1 protein translocase subunit SecF [Methanoregulaceae archaeon]
MGMVKYNIEKYSTGQLMAIPAILLGLSLVLLAFNMVSTGMPVTPGIEYAGGYSYTVVTTQTDDQIRAVFTGYPLSSVKEGPTGKQLQFGPMDEATLAALNGVVTQNYPDHEAVSSIDATFGSSNQSMAVLALIISFIGMSVVVFITFRTFIPSIAVVLSAFADMAMTAAAMNIVGIQLTLGTTAALLMLIGYSVDSDILLTNRVLKRQGKLPDKLAGAFHTGMIMTSTTFAAITAMFLASWIGGVTIMWEISAVLLIGLAADVLNTWLTNAAILRWYVQKGGGK